jgi:ATP-dependent exoDNAse (exonuclease V) beta subunit
MDVLEDISAMHPKKNANPVIVGIQDQLHRLLNKLCTQCQDEFALYNTAVLLSTNIGNLRLMQVFSEQLSNYRSENKELLISDTHLLLRKLTAETDASFIYEKTGNLYRHFLIDEFQDTSSLQWDNFKPLLENSLGEGNYNLLVGDVKQSIYRWRGGDRRLLQQTVKHQLGNFKVEELPLSDNYRSARPVIEFNNYLYSVLPAILQSQVNGTIGNVPQETRQKLVVEGYNQFITDAYAESLQHIPGRSPVNGLVQLEFLEESEETYDDQVLPLLFDKISSLLSEGFSANDIGILTRGNQEAARVINYLSGAQQEEGAPKFDILSADALLLKTNNAVSLLIRALEYLSGKGGKLSLANLRHLVVVQEGLDLSYYDRFVSHEEEEAILPISFTSHRNALRRLPLPELVGELISIFELHKNPSDAAYLLAFQDQVGEWSRYGNDGIVAFLTYWEDEGSGQSLEAGANANAIQVMTIHKSKGLDFNILLLPYLNWSIVPSSAKGMQVWVNTTETPFSEVPVVPVRYSSKMEETLFSFEYFRELMDTIIDNLNLLYVATTRARRRIIGWAPKPKKITDITCIEQLLYAAATSSDVIGLDDEKLKITPIRKAFEFEENKWNYGEDDAEINIKEFKEPELLPTLAPANWKSRLTVQVKSLLTEEEYSQQLPRQIGILLHDAMARLTNPSMVDAVVLQMSQVGLLTPSQQLNVREMVKEIVEQPILQGWKNGSLQRLSEREIINNGREIRRPDLVLYNKEETIVIDFKFTGDRHAHERYEKQVQEYINLLHQTGFANIRGYLLYAGNEIEAVEVKTS